MNKCVKKENPAVSSGTNPFGPISKLRLVTAQRAMRSVACGAPISICRREYGRSRGSARKAMSPMRCRSHTGACGSSAK